MDSAEFAPSCNRGGARCPHGNKQIIQVSSLKARSRLPLLHELTVLTQEQSDYTSVKVGGPFMTTVTEL